MYKPELRFTNMLLNNANLKAKNIIGKAWYNNAFQSSSHFVTLAWSFCLETELNKIICFRYRDRATWQFALPKGYTNKINITLFSPLDVRIGWLVITH